MRSLNLIKAVIIFIMLSTAGCSIHSDDDDPPKAEVCWRIIDGITGEPLEGATLSIKYDYYGSGLGPFLATATADVSGRACYSFPSGYNIINGSVYASGYLAQNFNTGYIPSVIEMQPQEDP